MSVIIEFSRCIGTYSCAKFEYINKIVFHDAALIIRVDVDKEFRNNIVKRMENIKEKIQSTEDCDMIKEEMKKLKQTLIQVMEEAEFQVRAGIAKDKKHNKYFYADIPILAEKYKGILID